MGSGPAAVRRSTALKSNAEFTASLRANFCTAQQNAESNTYVNGNGPHSPPYKSWTSQEDNTVFIPALDFTKGGLAEERSQYEITVKLFFVPRNPAWCRCAQTREAVNLVLRELRVPHIDLLIVSYPGISFDAEDEDGSDLDLRSEGSISVPAIPSEDGAEDIDTMMKTWGCLEELHDEGIITNLGVSEFGTGRLSKFLHKTRVRPSVNQINVRDCCVVPKTLILYAKQEGIDLLTHNDCTNILPRGTVREMLGNGQGGAGILAGPDGEDGEDGLKGDVEPQWVIKYTAVVKNRGVIENKGYFALADLVNG